MKKDYLGGENDVLPNFKNSDDVNIINIVSYLPIYSLYIFIYLKKLIYLGKFQ